MPNYIIDDNGYYVNFYKGKQTEATSMAECDYYVGVIETMNPVSFHDKNLDKLLQPHIPTEKEVISSIQTGNIDFTENEPNLIQALSLDKELVKALLIGSFDRAINRFDAIPIVLPDEDFEQRISQFMKAIYLYMPYRLRAYSGWSTNYQNNQHPMLSTFIFYRESQKPANALTLNPNECRNQIDKIQKQSQSRPQGLLECIEYICNCSPQERRQLNEYFWQELEGNGDLNTFTAENIDKGLWGAFMQYGPAFIKMKDAGKLSQSKEVITDANIPKASAFSVEVPSITTETNNPEIDKAISRIKLIIMSAELSNEDKLKAVHQVIQTTDYIFEPYQEKIGM